MPSIRRLLAHEWPLYRDLRLRALADAPNAFGSTLEVEREHAEEHWAERLASGAASRWEAPLIAEENGMALGLVWGKIDPLSPETAHVYQMWVAPGGRGMGAGAALLAAVIEWARAVGARSVALNVTCGDPPAWRLYARTGFKPVGDPHHLRPGSAVLAQAMRLELGVNAPDSGLLVAPRIRRFRTADHPRLMHFLDRVLTGLGFEFLPDGKDGDVYDLEAVYLSNRGSFFVVDVDGEIRGSVGVRRFAPDIAELKRLYLSEELRGRGLGRDLCVAAIEDARELGYRYLRLDTTGRSPAAIALFRGLGFYEIGRYNTNPHAEIFMECML